MYISWSFGNWLTGRNQQFNCCWLHYVSQGIKWWRIWKRKRVGWGWNRSRRIIREREREWRKGEEGKIGGGDRGSYWEGKDEREGEGKGRGIYIVPWALKFGHFDLAGIRVTALVQLILFQIVKNNITLFDLRFWSQIYLDAQLRNMIDVPWVNKNNSKITPIILTFWLKSQSFDTHCR